MSRANSKGLLGLSKPKRRGLGTSTLRIGRIADLRGPGVKALSLLISGTLLVVVGCGGGATSSRTSGAGPTIRNADPWTEAQVMQAAGLTTDTDGLAYTTASGCTASVVMTNAATVNLYAGAGDTVVTNPDGTAGVKTVGSDRRCLLELQRGLASLAHGSTP